VLDFSDTTVNPATGSVNLRATIPNPKHSLLPGMYVTLKANLGQQHKVFLIPQQAVQRDTVGAYVMTVGSDGKVKRKDVTTTDMSTGNWVVTDGLQAGDQVVVSGIQNVKDGAPAKASPWHAAPAAGSSSANAPGTAPSGK
jgi:membrane fusion protein, multidrug efflux system